MAKDKVYSCGYELTMELIGGKWTGLILWHLHDKKVLRNGEMLRLMPNITQKMLTQQLREMEENGLVKRVIYEQVPPKVEYSITAHGESLRPVMEMLYAWGVEYAQDNNITLVCDNNEKGKK